MKKPPTASDDPPEESEQKEESMDPKNLLDIEGLRLSQDFTSMAGVKKLITTVPVRKPDRQSFVRVHPDEGWRLWERSK